MTEDDLKDFISENSDRIKEAAVQSVIDRIQQDLRYQLPDSVRQVVSDFMTNEVAPAVAEALKGERGAIISAATKAASEIGDALSKKMVSDAVENLTGYRGGEVIKSLFK